MFIKKTIRDVDLSGKRVFLRADYNVPIDEFGAVSDDFRIKQSIPTIKYILEQNPRSLTIASHLGRPKGPDDAKCSLLPVVARLSELLSNHVEFAKNCVGEEVQSVIQNLPDRGVLLLENLRYHNEEEENSSDFAAQLASGQEVYIDDAFGAAHRAHASLDAITHHIQTSVSGLLLAKEVDLITNVMQNPERPLVAIVGGAKISDKIEILNKFIDVADVVVVVGAMANTFLAAKGVKVGKSLVELDKLDLAKEIMEKCKQKELDTEFKFVIPRDYVVSTQMDGSAKTRVVDIDTHILSDIEAYPKLPKPEQHEIADDESIFDVGPLTANYIAGLITGVKSVVWNGTCGVTETKGHHGAAAPFSHASKLILDTLQGEHKDSKLRPFSVVGGGDTVGFVMENAGIDSETGLPFGIAHVSTGGGASLELMSGLKLPGVEALNDK
jgi:phosphoglycerate kinase